MQALADTPRKLEEAQQNFDAVMEAALSGSPQMVQPADEEAMVVVSLADFERLTKRDSQFRSRASFVDHLLTYPSDEVDASRLNRGPWNFSALLF